MKVTRVEGPHGPLPHLVPSAWWRDETTLCVFLDNPRNGLWLILSIDLRAEVEASQAENQEETTRW